METKAKTKTKRESLNKLKENKVNIGRALEKCIKYKEIMKRLYKKWGLSGEQILQKSRDRELVFSPNI